MAGFMFKLKIYTNLVFSIKMSILNGIHGSRLKNFSQWLTSKMAYIVLEMKIEANLVVCSFKCNSLSWMVETS